jgi:hypothetical protein
MRRLLAHLLTFWAGGVTVLFTYYAVWLAVNPQCHMNWYTVNYFLLWPYYRYIDVVAWCL